MLSQSGKEPLGSVPGDHNERPCIGKGECHGNAGGATIAWPSAKNIIMPFLQNTYFTEL